MAQYQIGSVNLVNGSSTVTGVATAWSKNIRAGQLFHAVGDEVTYEIAAVLGDQELRLTSPYEGETANGATYAVVRDFTALLSIPYVEKGDIATATVIKRSMKTIEEAILETKNGLSVVVSRTQQTPPSQPAVGDAYIVPPSPSGPWQGHTTEIAVAQSGGNWKFVAPKNGRRVNVVDETFREYFFDATDQAWIALPELQSPVKSVDGQTGHVEVAPRHEAVAFSLIFGS